MEPKNHLLNRAEFQTAKAAIFAISGINCRDCVMPLKNILLMVEGLFYTEFIPDRNLGVFVYNPKNLHTDDLIKTVENTKNKQDIFYKATLLVRGSAQRILYTAGSKIIRE